MEEYNKDGDKLINSSGNLEKLDKNLRNSFSSVKRDIKVLNKTHNEEISGLEKSIIALKESIEKAREGSAGKKELEKYDEKIRKLEKSAREISIISERLDSEKKAMDELSALKEEVEETEEKAAKGLYSAEKASRESKESSETVKKLNSKIRKISEQLDSLKKSAIMLNEFDENMDEIVAKISEAKGEISNIERMRNQINSIAAGERKSEQKIASLGKSMLPKSDFEKGMIKRDERIDVLKEYTDSIYNSVSELRAKKVSSDDFESELELIEKELSSDYRKIEELYVLKKELSRIKQLDGRIAIIEESSVSAGELSQKSSKLYQRIRELETEINDIAFSIKKHDKAFSDIWNRTVSKEIFDMEFDKSDVRLKRNQQEIERLKEQISEVDDVERKLEILSMDMLERERKLDNYMTKSEFYSAISAVKGRFYDLKAVVDEKTGRKESEVSLKKFISPKRNFIARAGEAIREFFAENDDTEKAEEESILYEPEKKALTHKERKEKGEGAAFFSSLGKKISDFFTIEESVKEKRGMAEKKKEKKKRQEEKKIPWAIFIIALIIGLGLFLFLNYKEIGKFSVSAFERIKEGLTKQEISNATGTNVSAPVKTAAPSQKPSESAVSNASISQNATKATEGIGLKISAAAGKIGAFFNGIWETARKWMVESAGGFFRRTGNAVKLWATTAWDWIKGAAADFIDKAVQILRYAKSAVIAYKCYIIAGILMLTAIIFLSQKNRLGRLFRFLGRFLRFLGRAVLNFFTVEEAEKPKARRAAKKK